jgi:hypothetical protein
MEISRVIRTLLFLGMALVTFSSAAFIGNNMFGKNWCVVACGRGPFGIAPLGDVIKGANEMAFGPTLEAFEQRGKNIVDYASAKLDQSQVKLDKGLEENLAKFAEITQDSVAQLDQVLQSNINIGLEGLARQVAALDIVGSKKTDDLNTILRGFVLLGVAALLVLWIAKTVDHGDFAWKKAWIAARWRIATSTGVIALVVAIPNIIPQLQYKIPEIRHKLESNYETQMQALSFQRAAFIAEKLVAIDSEDISYLRQRDTAELLRNVFYNPTSYRTIDGLTRTQFMLESLLTNTTQGPQAGEKLKIQPDSNLEITFAMIAWQIRQDDIARYQAANICATVIEREIKLKPDERTALLPLAIHYLKVYLSNPIQTFEYKWLLQGKVGGSDDDYASAYKPKTTDELRDLLTIAESAPKSISASFEGNRLSAQIQFGQKTVEVYQQAIPAYVRMLLAHFEMRKASPEAKIQLKALRDKYASEVIRAWDSVSTTNATPGIQADLNSRLTLLSALHATYTRAKLYLKMDQTGVVRASLTEAESKALPESDKFHELWIKDMQGSIRPSGVPLIGFRIRAQYEIDQSALSKFEAALSALVDKPDNWELAREAANQSSRLGLFVCAKQLKDPEADAFTIDDCDAAQTFQYKAIWLIYSMIPSNNRPSVASWKNFMELGIQRPTPVI